ncbi:MAG: Fur family transcriptional regulator [Bdellovibrionia bacterium]
MKKHKDLLAILKSKQMRITPGRRLLLQFILDNHSRQISLRDIQKYLDKKISGIDRSSIYRNLELFKKLEIIQELNLPKLGKRFQYVFDRKVHHFFICKVCGKLSREKKELFERIDLALKDVHGFETSNLSLIFYGCCVKCSPRPTKHLLNI